MNIIDRDRVIDSCEEAAHILAAYVPDRDLKYKETAAQILNTFLYAALGNSIAPAKHIQAAQQKVLHLTSCDNLPLQVTSPVIWNGLTALRAAATQFQFD